MNITIGRDSLSFDGRPRFLFGGDFNYTRTPRRQWRDRLLKMKAAGLNTVAFYATWAYHEAEPGRWDWAGDRDMAAFLDLIHAEGMWAILRMGPFIHGEWRNGGLPQWLFDRLGAQVRTNAPAYLDAARAWYGQLLPILLPRQVTRGGPVAIVQLENELGSAGSKGDDIARGSADPEENAKHVQFFQDLVRQAGVDLPIIDINHFPGKESMPGLVDAGGGYPVNCFGSDGEVWPMSVDWWKSHARPKITIETGAGMFVRYYDWPAYRHTNGFQGPIVHPSIIEAMTYGHLAEGVAGINYYVFTDGQHAEQGGERMLPERDMNYQAPLTVVGGLRESYHCIKRIGWFLRAFEQEVLGAQPNPDWARATSHGVPHPGVELSGDLFEGYHGAGTKPADHLAHVTPVECLGRTTKGLNLSEPNFLFLRNTRNHGARWKRDVHVVTSPRGIPCEVSQEYPKQVQLALPPQRNKCLPFFVRLAKGVFLEYSTAELLDRRMCGGTVQAILHADADELTETRLVVPARGAVAVQGEAVALWESPNAVTIVGRPGTDLAVVTVPGAQPLRLVLMERRLAGEVWDVATPDGPAVMASGLRLLDSRLEGDRTRLLVQAEDQDFTIAALLPRRPRWDGPGALAGESWDAGSGVWRAHGRLPMPRRELAFRTRREGDDLVWEAEVDPALLDGLHELALRATYDGTLARAELDGRLISDHPYGRHLMWEIGLRDWLVRPGTLRLVFEGSRRADVAVRPIVQTDAFLSWT